MAENSSTEIAVNDTPDNSSDAKTDEQSSHQESISMDQRESKAMESSDSTKTDPQQVFLDHQPENATKLMDNRQMDLAGEADTTMTVLSELWQEIGFSPQECQSAKTEMCMEVKRVFSNKISNTQEIKCGLNTQIRLASARTKTIAAELGESDAPSSDPNNNQPLRLQLSALKAHLEALESKKAERSKIISGKVEELNTLFNELEDTLNAEQGKFLRNVSDFTQGRIDQLEARIRETIAERERRQSRCAEIVAAIKGLWDTLGISETDDQDELDVKIRGGGGGWKLTQAALRSLEERQAALEGERQRRREESAGLFAALDRLWDRVRADPAAREAFRAAHAGLTAGALAAVRAEIAAVEETKRRMMQGLVLEARAALVVLWDGMRLADAARREFAPAFQEVFTEDSLRLHEEEIARCTARLEAMQPLLKMVDRRDFIKAEDAAMKEALADPSRLLGRGRGMAEKLKQEEKVRNMVSKEMPKLTEKLRAAILEFECSQGMEFTVNGERVADALDREDADAAHAREEARLKKAGGAAAAASAPPARPESAGPASCGKPKALPGTPAAAAAGGTENARPGSATAKFRAVARALPMSGNERTPLASVDKGNDSEMPPPRPVIKPLAPAFHDAAHSSSETSSAHPPVIKTPREGVSGLKTPRRALAIAASAAAADIGPLSPKTGLPKQTITPKVK